MRRVAEIIYLVESEREAFLRGALNPSKEEQKILWLCGVRKQQYFELNELIFMTFEYQGDNFNNDMAKMAAYLDSKGLLIKKRRKDVPLEERATTSWWAPVKKLGDVLATKPDFEEDKDDLSYMDIIDGCMDTDSEINDIAYDEDEWVDAFQII